ncbi:MAG: tetratricopeptide repeat protein, partial [Planctomycetes bacterium]|nr:tetratricopeptide repeat protein [Planctomycetota bacterium]
FEGALVKFKDAQVEEPDSPVIHFNLGLAFYRLERYDEAATSFEQATLASDLKLEKAAFFHLANCQFRQGKLQTAVENYNRALERDPEYEDAKVNRELVIRRIKELEAKREEQQQKEEAEKKIIEKLQALIEQQIGVHVGTRMGMLLAGEELPDTKIERLEEITKVTLPEGQEPGSWTEEQIAKAMETVGASQGELLEEARSLLAEMRAKVEAPPPDPSAGPDPHEGAAPPDPEIEKLKKALPFMTAAEPAMESARRGAQSEGNWNVVHAGQQEALVQLLRALDELLDELTRIIQDQAQLLKDGFKLKGTTENPDESQRPEATALRDKGVVHAERERKLETRTTAVGQAVEQQLGTLREQANQAAAPGGAGTAPGQDPQEQVRAFETALGHLNAASVAMQDAASSLSEPDLDSGLELESKALEELIRAKQALSPPQPGQGEGEQDKEKQEQQDQKQDGEPKKPEEDKQPKDQEQKGQDGQDPNQKDQPPISTEQAEKALEQAEQRERDRRKERRAKAAGGGQGGPDW